MAAYVVPTAMKKLGGIREKRRLKVELLIRTKKMERDKRTPAIWVVLLLLKRALIER